MRRCFFLFLMLFVMLATMQTMSASANSTTSTKDVYDRLVEEFDFGDYMEVMRIFEEDMRHRAVIEQRDSALYYNYSCAMEAAFFRDDFEAAKLYLDSLPDTFQKTVAFRFYVTGIIHKQNDEYGNALEAFQQAEGIFDSAIHIADLLTQTGATAGSSVKQASSPHFRVSSIEDRSVFLEWDNPDNLQCTISVYDSMWRVCAEMSGAAIQIKGLTPATQYKFRLDCENVSTETEWIVTLPRTVEPEQEKIPSPLQPLSAFVALPRQDAIDAILTVKGLQFNGDSDSRHKINADPAAAILQQLRSQRTSAVAYWYGYPSYQYEMHGGVPLETLRNGFYASFENVILVYQSTYTGQYVSLHAQCKALHVPIYIHNRPEDPERWQMNVDLSEAILLFDDCYGYAPGEYKWSVYFQDQLVAESSHAVF